MFAPSKRYNKHDVQFRKRGWRLALYQWTMNLDKSGSLGEHVGLKRGNFLPLEAQSLFMSKM